MQGAVMRCSHFHEVDLVSSCSALSDPVLHNTTNENYEIHRKPESGISGQLIKTYFILDTIYTLICRFLYSVISVPSGQVNC